MAEIDVQSDLKAVTEKMEALVDELNKVNAHREQLVGQVQNLQGVLMYLRGKDDSPEVINEGGVPEEVVEKAKEAIQEKINEGDKEVTDGNMPQAVLDAAHEAIKDNKGDKDS
jgi:hypothetical protein